MTAIARPNWRPYPVTAVLQMLLRATPDTAVVTIGIHQPADVFHQVGYDEGCYILELDGDEQPVAAYHRGAVS